MSSKYTWATFIAVGLCAPAVAQPPAPPVPTDADKLFILQNMPPLPVFSGNQIDFIRSEGGVPGPVVKAKPYSARSITESTQTLADGNRITERNESVIYRDSEGRTRLEQTLGGIGPFQPDEPVTMINIHDPVAGKSYMLDPAERIAREMPQFKMAIAHDQALLNIEQAEIADGETRAVFNVAVPAPAPVPAPVGAGTASVTVIQRTEGDQDVRVYTRAQRGVVISPFPEGTTGAYEPAEDLGAQVLEGLLVKGTRMTDTMPNHSMFAKPETGFDVFNAAWPAQLVVFLASEAAGDLNGQGFVVWGGEVMLVGGWHTLNQISKPNAAFTAHDLIARKDELFGKHPRQPG